MISKLFKKIYATESIDSERCIFISGCPRSGTSLLTKIIDSHPDISILMDEDITSEQSIGPQWIRFEMKI
jgi:hypothetical protein